MEESAQRRFFPNASYVDEVPVAELRKAMAFSPVTKKVVPFWPSENVTAGKGTGLVHVGPACSVEDYELFQRSSAYKELPELTDDFGVYLPEAVPVALHGARVVKNKQYGDANERVLDFVRGLVVEVRQEPMTLAHSWRSDALLYTKASSQWFVSLKDLVEDPDLSEVEFVPESGRSRFLAKLTGRPDWLVSRQRYWGTPMAVFANDAGELLTDPDVLYTTLDLVTDEGSDAWFTVSPEKLLGNHDPKVWHKVMDVLDVWFDSGCVHTFQNREVADLYLEGHDQH
jgi:isoleucyl-tRNA synthetase